MRILFSLLLLFSSPAAAEWSAEVPLTLSSLGPAALSQVSPAAAWNGESWLAVWTHEERIHGAIVGSDGSLRSQLPIVFDTAAGSLSPVAAVGWNGERYLVAWRAAYSYVRVQWVSADGELIGEVIETGAGGDLGRGPGIASNGSEIALVGANRGAALFRRDGTITWINAASLGLEGRAIASDGDSFVIVDTTGSAIAGITVSGEVAWRKSLPSLQSPSIVWTGNHYLLTGNRDGRLEAIRLSSNGEALGERFALDGEIQPWWAASLAAVGGGDVLAAWNLEGEGFRIARIEPGGTVDVKAEAVDGFFPAIAAGNGAHLLIWNNDGDVVHQRVSSAGEPLDEPRPTSLSASEQRWPTVTATARGFLAAWEERRNTEGRVALALAGRPSARSMHVIESSAYPYRHLNPALAAAGDVVVAAWAGPWATVQRFTSDGAPLDPEPIKLGSVLRRSLAAERMAVIWTGRFFLLVWPDHRELSYVRMTAEGIVLDQEARTVPHSQRALLRGLQALTRIDPELARVGDRILLVWQASYRLRGPCGQCVDIPPWIEGIRLDADGNLLDSEPIMLSQGSSAGEDDPEVTSDGQSFIVAWEKGDAFVHGVRVSPEGIVSPLTGLEEARGWLEDLAGANGRTIMLTLETPLDGGRELVARELGAGNFVGSPEVLASGTLVPEPGPFAQRIGEAAIAAREGGGFLVVYARVEPELGMVRRLWSRALEYPTRRRPVAR